MKLKLKIKQFNFELSVDKLIIITVLMLIC